MGMISAFGRSFRVWSEASVVLCSGLEDEACLVWAVRHRIGIHMEFWRLSVRSGGNVFQSRRNITGYQSPPAAPFLQRPLRRPG